MKCLLIWLLFPALVTAQWTLLVSGGAEPGGGSGAATLELDATTGALRLVSTSVLGNGGVGGWTSARPGSTPDALPTLLFATRRAGSGQQGSVQAVSVNATGGMSPLGTPQLTGGADPEHVQFVSPAWVLTANYGSAHVGVQSVRDDGTVGPPLAGLQVGTNAHEIAVDPANSTRIFVPCLGADYIAQLVFDNTTGALAPAANPVAVMRGSGPRHIIFHPNGRTALLVNELGATAAVFEYSAATGLLAPNPSYVSTIPSSVSANGQHAAEILLSPDAAFVYVTNRGPYCGIALFSVVGGSGGGAVTLQPAGFYSENDPVTNWPRAASFVAGGRFLVVAGERSMMVASFARDATTGALTRVAALNLTGAVDGPSCVHAYTK